MSWLDNIKQPFTITTGDGVTYTPLWDPTKSVSLVQEFNIADFNFKGTPGTLVDRGEVKGNLYDVEIIFSGEDHLIKAKDFRESAADAGARTRGRLKKPWTINHPYYGILVVQPIRLKYGNEEGNITRITGQVLETIKGSATAADVNAFDKITVDKVAVDGALFDAYVAQVTAPTITDINGMLDNISIVDGKVSLLTKLSDDYNKFRNAVSKAKSLVNDINSYIDTATDYMGRAMAAIQAVISLPAVFFDSEKNRLQMMFDMFNALVDTIEDIPATIAALYENNAGTIVSSTCLSAVTNVTQDYDYMPDVVDVIDEIVAIHNKHLDNLDALQAANGSAINSFMPDADSLNQLSALVNFTVTTLLEIAASAKQQVTYALPEDDNVITLAYKLYGTAADDVVDKLIADNNINFREMLVIKKGREIVYYV